MVETMELKSGLHHDWITILQEFSIRFVIAAVIAVGSGWFVAKNWSYYTDELLGVTVKDAPWFNPTVNVIIGIVMYSILGLTWSRLATKHEDSVRMDLFFFIALGFTFITFTLLFETKDNGSSSKWFAILGVISMAYLVFESFHADPWVAWTIVIALAIWTYLMSQIWYMGHLGKIKDCDTSSTQCNYTNGQFSYTA